MKGSCILLFTLLFLLHCTISEKKIPIKRKKLTKENDTLRALKEKLEFLKKVSEKRNALPTFKENIALVKKKILELEENKEETKQTTDENENAKIRHSRDNENGKKNEVDNEKCSTHDGEYSGEENEVNSAESEDIPSKEDVSSESTLTGRSQEPTDSDVENFSSGVSSIQSSTKVGEKNKLDELATNEHPGKDTTVERVVTTPSLKNASSEASQNGDTSKPSNSQKYAIRQPNVDLLEMPYPTRPLPNEVHQNIFKDISIPPMPDSMNKRAFRMRHLDGFYDESNLCVNKMKDIPFQNFPCNYNNFNMNSREYEVVKNLIDYFFKKGDNDNVNANIINLFKKVLDDERLRNEFKNFMYDLYCFAKQNNYLKNDKINDEMYKILLDNALQIVKRMLTQ
ncbi:merozoite surface protein 7 (MSP7) (MSP7.1) [Plasmodium ovale curtisi]|uniref:Merozoite surface protein 7 (MSP7) (MSP7.1) n=1 Tax=Plasmodium ovale curtisi TaxID=864141 RepID=A0A1A8WSC9_PLAOA|nr:merozoite surface protein 7 (MSP7) (MSP7.1) [Plasmodium ovale curtisi]SBS96292.1 merozoite surface protein 7 (MSP7) (MSP7.1) [Plasmodium ovale curtisi]